MESLLDFCESLEGNKVVLPWLFGESVLEVDEVQVREVERPKRSQDWSWVICGDDGDGGDVMVIVHLHYILWVSEWRSACVWQKAVANVTGHRGHPVHDVEDHDDNDDGIDNK